MGKGRPTVLHAVCNETIARHLDRIAALEAENEGLRAERDAWHSLADSGMILIPYDWKHSPEHEGRTGGLMKKMRVELHERVDRAVRAALGGKGE